MKNISALYGGGVSTNDIEFIKFCSLETSKYSSFPIILFFKQNLIYLLLKIISVNLVYKIFFFSIFRHKQECSNMNNETDAKDSGMV